MEINRFDSINRPDRRGFLFNFVFILILADGYRVFFFSCCGFCARQKLLDHSLLWAILNDLCFLTCFTYLDLLPFDTQNYINSHIKTYTHTYRHTSVSYTKSKLEADSIVLFYVCLSSSSAYFMKNGNFWNENRDASHPDPFNERRSYYQTHCCHTHTHIWPNQKARIMFLKRFMGDSWLNTREFSISAILYLRKHKIITRAELWHI